ncbi:MAG: DUF177 domain-containing protein [Bacteriovorax sp.]|nr:DUF177 domain-containing protein [Bacteriovorax sp.]
MSKIQTHLDPKVFVPKFGMDVIEEYELDKTTTPWVNELLVELEEENDDEAEFPAAEMTIKAQITRKTNTLLKDHLVVRAQLKAHFHLPCGRCLYPLPQELDLDLAAAFIHESQEKLPEYVEATTVYADGQEMELYFYHKGMADIREFIHEQIYIEVTPFPRCDGECKNPVLF